MAVTVTHTHKTVRLVVGNVGAILDPVQAMELAEKLIKHASAVDPEIRKMALEEGLWSE